MAYTPRKLLLLLAAVTAYTACSDGSVDPTGVVTNPPDKPGQTDFTTDEFGSGDGTNNEAGGPGRANGGGVPTASPQSPPAADSASKAPPMGRTADVEEADIYRVDGNRLFYLNTYRGFVIYDVNDPKKPVRLSRLPVFGYPVEMFVDGNTVYALLREALYLTQVGDKLQFERHNVSQLVAIDISDVKNPRVLKTVDIFGHLREGVSRKIDKTIYVVSYVPQSYRWGWRPDPSQQKEQAWVYSFDVSNPGAPKPVDQKKIFEGGSVQFYDQNSGSSYNKTFSGVAISATSNALMIVENWNISSYVNGTSGSGGGSGSSPRAWSCGSYNSNQQAVVSIVDVSDPTGKIDVHSRFETKGHLNDQFKMTYEFDEATKTGTFYGIFGRQVWSSSNCQGQSYTQNTLESWDLTSGTPARLDSLDFGKPNETVRGSAFDVQRKVVYAITAERIDPLYAIGFSDRKDLKILSAIDGLSGDMSVFRLVGDRKFLLAVGTDNSNACSGFQDTAAGWRSAKMAVSLIDVENLNNIRLVQRQCVAVKNADWVTSQISSNLDQAHKMLGMHADGSLNVITVPVSYSKRAGDNDWWWYRWETAVGLMTWDLTKYDRTKQPFEQNVIENFGTFVHPNGEVKRTIVFNHQGATPRRMMINLSDTHISVADLQDMKNPTLQSVVELAPYYNQIYKFGDYIVEQVQSQRNGWSSNDLAEFRVKKVGGDLEEATMVASFQFGQVYRVIKHNDNLVLFRRVQENTSGKLLPPGGYTGPLTEAMVIDMRDPTKPRAAGRITVPALSVPYYPYWCGVGAYWGGFWFDQVANWATIDAGLVMHTTEWRYDGQNSTQTNRLVLLDLRNPDAPKISEAPLPTTVEWGAFGLVPDPTNPAGFFVSYRKRVGDRVVGDGTTYATYRYYAQRWQPDAGQLKVVEDVNLPGRLVRVFKNGDDFSYLAQDTSYRRVGEGKTMTVFADQRLWLLRRVTVAGKPAAELRDTRTFVNLYPTALLVADGKLLVSARPQENHFYGGYADAPVRSTGGSSSSSTTPLPSWETSSDRLMIFDVAGGALREAYNQPTRMYNIQLMGTHQGKLFVNLTGSSGGYYYDGYGYGGGGDGILVIDVSNPAAPRGVKFLRTLGYASHIEFAGDDVYVAAGYFGLFHMKLGAASDIPLD